jgi:serine/threonine protein kinase
MSLEKCLGDLKLVNFQSDDYALGVLLYEPHSGKVPFDKSTAILSMVSMIPTRTTTQRENSTR